MIRIISILVLLGGLLPPSLVVAEFSCSSQVFYSWKAVQEQKDNRQKVDQKQPEATPQKVMFSNPRVSSSTEIEAKQRLESSLIEESLRAQRHCQQRHEETATCLSGKFLSVGPSLEGLSFEARRAVERSIEADCQRLAGICLEPSWSEVVCTQVGGGEQSEEKTDKKDGA